MGYIKKKEGNLLIPKALYNGHWQTKSSQEREFKKAVGQDNVVFLPQHENQGPVQSQKEMWIGHGAVASVLVIFCGLLVIQNMESLREVDGNRGLASDPFSTPDLVEENQQDIDNDIVEDLNSGRRDLSSINDTSLEEREYFEHTVLNSYYVEFDSDDILTEVQLRPEKSPIYIKSHTDFIQNNRGFFPAYSQFQNVNQFFDEDEQLKTSVYRLSGSGESVDVSFQTDAQDMLISIIIENQE
ncbi:MAG: hypothetical protein OXK80_01125 [Bdellovibrionales bacterium]|nr:hypothetical protein [Bdellovibrionales bacterium]